jgi:hypothetical protein
VKQQEKAKATATATATTFIADCADYADTASFWFIRAIREIRDSSCLQLLL